MSNLRTRLLAHRPALYATLERIPSDTDLCLLYGACCALRDQLNVAKKYNDTAELQRNSAIPIVSLSPGTSTTRTTRTRTPHDEHIAQLNRERRERRKATERMEAAKVMRRGVLKQLMQTR